jgi:hypothetical protein
VWLRDAPVEASQRASHRRTTYLAAQYRRLADGHGAKRAIVMVAPSALVISDHLRHDETTYREQTSSDDAGCRVALAVAGKPGWMSQETSLRCLSAPGAAREFSCHFDYTLAPRKSSRGLHHRAALRRDVHLTRPPPRRHSGPDRLSGPGHFCMFGGRMVGVKLSILTIQ